MSDHAELFPTYVQILKDLRANFSVQDDRSYHELVNFEGNRQLPIHSWFDYGQGYSQELVRKIISLYGHTSSGSFVLDPFVGVGTTLLTSQLLGLRSVGLEINPVATFASTVKTHHYSEADILQIENKIANCHSLLKQTEKIPKYKRLSNIFTEHQLEQLMHIKGFYESIDQNYIRDFFKLAYLSIIEDCSNRIKDGNGIKISNNKPLISNVISYFLSKCKMMISDLRTVKPRTEAVVLQGSILQDAHLDLLKQYDIGTVVFSPPYANCFDYCEVYKMEIWLGDFVEEYADFRKYRSQAIRSHVNASFNHEIVHRYDKVDAIAALIGTYNIWNKNIPDMLRGYFDDLRQVLSRLGTLMKPGSYCSIVVANSSYKGIIVPTDLLLAEIAKSLGYEVRKIISARQIRASSQQIPELRDHGDLMRESIIILRK